MEQKDTLETHKCQKYPAILIQNQLHRVSQQINYESIRFIYCGHFSSSFISQLTSLVLPSDEKQAHLSNILQVVQKSQWQWMNIYIISSDQIDKKIEDQLLQKVSCIFYCLQTQRYEVKARVYNYKSEQQMLQRGSKQIAFLSKTDLVSKNFPNYSSLQENCSQLNISRANMYWILQDHQQDKLYQKLFIEFITHQKQFKGLNQREYSVQNLTQDLETLKLFQNYNCIRTYTYESFFFEIINRSLRSLRNPEYMPYFKMPVSLLYQQVRSLWKKQLNEGYFQKLEWCYRGCTLTYKQIEDLKKRQGQIIQFQGFLSTSATKDNAQMFGHHLIKIKISENVKRNKDYLGGFAFIGEYSVKAGQLEILFNPMNYYRVSKICEDQQNQLQIIFQLVFIGEKNLQSKNIGIIANHIMYTNMCKNHIKNQGNLFYYLGNFSKCYKFHIKRLQQRLNNSNNANDTFCKQLNNLIQNMGLQSPKNSQQSWYKIMGVFSKQITQDLKGVYEPQKIKYFILLQQLMILNATDSGIIGNYCNYLQEKQSINAKDHWKLYNEFIYGILEQMQSHKICLGLSQQKYQKYYRNIKKTLEIIQKNTQFSTQYHQLISQFLINHQTFTKQKKVQKINKLKTSIKDIIKQEGYYGPSSLKMAKMIELVFFISNRTKINQLSQQLQMYDIIVKWVSNRQYLPTTVQILSQFNKSNNIQTQIGLLYRQQMSMVQKIRLISSMSQQYFREKKGKEYKNLLLFTINQFIIQGLQKIKESNKFQDKIVYGRIFMKVGQVLYSFGKHQWSFSIFNTVQQILDLNQNHKIEFMKGIVKQKQGKNLVQLGKNKEAKQYLEFAYNIFVKQLGKSHYMTTQTLILIARVQENCSDFQQIRKIIQTIHQNNKISPISSQIIYYDFLALKGRYYFNTYQLQQAQKCFQKMLIHQQQHNTQNKFASINTLMDLSKVYSGLKKYQLAIKISHEALQISQNYLDVQSYGKSLYVIGMCKQTLGFNYLCKGQLSIAQKYLQQALEIFMNVKQTYTFQRIAATYDGLAQIGLRWGNFKKQIFYLQKAIQLRQQYHPPYYIYNLLNKVNLACIYIINKINLQRGINLMQQCQYVLNKHNQSMQYSNLLKNSFMNKMGQAYFMIGQYSKSIKIFEQALTDIKQSQSDIKNTILKNLQKVYLLQKNYPKQQQILNIVTEQVIKVYGKNHKQYADVIFQQGLLYLHIKQYKKASMRFLQAKNIIDKIYGQEHYYSCDILNHISQLRYRQGDQQQWLQYKDKLFCCIKNVQNHQFNLKNIFVKSINLKMYTTAAKLKIMALAETVFGKQQPFSIMIHKLYGIIYYNIQKYIEAKKHFREALNQMKSSKINLQDEQQSILVFICDCDTLSKNIRSSLRIMKQLKNSENQPLRQKAAQNIMKIMKIQMKQIAYRKKIAITRNFQLISMVKLENIIKYKMKQTRKLKNKRLKHKIKNKVKKYKKISLSQNT